MTKKTIKEIKILLKYLDSNIENDSLERQKREQEVAQLLQELTTGNN